MAAARSCSAWSSRSARSATPSPPAPASARASRWPRTPTRWPSSRARWTCSSAGRATPLVQEMADARRGRPLARGVLAARASARGPATPTSPPSARPSTIPIDVGERALVELLERGMVIASASAELDTPSLRERRRTGRSGPELIAERRTSLAQLLDGWSPDQHPDLANLLSAARPRAGRASPRGSWRSGVGAARPGPRLRRLGLRLRPWPPGSASAARGPRLRPGREASLDVQQVPERADQSAKAGDAERESDDPEHGHERGEQGRSRARAASALKPVARRASSWLRGRRRTSARRGSRSGARRSRG